MRMFLAAVLAVGVVSCSSAAVSVREAASARDCEELLSFLEKSEPWLVEDAALGAGRAGCKAAVPRLTALLGDAAPTPAAKANAALSLAAMRVVEAVPLVVAEMERTSDQEARYWLAVAASRFCTPEAVAALEAAATDSDIFVSRGAKKGIVECGMRGQ